MSEGNPFDDSPKEINERILGGLDFVSEDMLIKKPRDREKLINQNLINRGLQNFKEIRNEILDDSAFAQFVDPFELDDDLVKPLKPLNVKPSALQQEVIDRVRFLTMYEEGLAPEVVEEFKKPIPPRFETLFGTTQTTSNPPANSRIQGTSQQDGVYSNPVEATIANAAFSDFRLEQLPDGQVVSIPKSDSLISFFDLRRDKVIKVQLENVLEEDFGGVASAGDAQVVYATVPNDVAPSSTISAREVFEDALDVKPLDVIAIERSPQGISRDKNSGITPGTAFALISASSTAVLNRVQIDPLDDLRAYVDLYLGTLGVEQKGAIIKAANDIAGEYGIFDNVSSGVALASTLGEIAKYRDEGFEIQFLEALDTIEALSQTRVSGVRMEGGFPVAQFVKVKNPSLYTPEELLAYTCFSLSPSDQKKQRRVFNKGIKWNAFPGAVNQLYERSSMLANDRARQVFFEAMTKREQRKTNELAARLDSGETVVVDAIGQGYSTHMSNFFTVLKYLRPDLTLCGIEQLAKPGQLWLERNFQRLNNTMGPARVDGGNLPRQGGDLFPLGNFNAMRVPFLAKGRWPRGDTVGTAIRYNAHITLDEFLMEHEVIEVSKDGRIADYAVVVEKEGTQRVLYTNYFFDATIGTDEMNPYRTNDGAIIDQESFDIWNTEIAKAKRGEPSLVYTYNLFARLIQTQAGIEQLFTNNEDERKIIGIGGPGDGGRCATLAFLRTLGSDFFPSFQLSGKRALLGWYGQPAQDAKQFSQGVEGVFDGARGVYSTACAGYTGLSLVGIPERVGFLRRNGNKLDVIRKGGVRDRGLTCLVTAYGFKQTPDEQIFSFAGEREIVYDVAGRAVASRFKDENCVRLGPGADVPIRLVGQDVVDKFAEVGIAENKVAAWVRGFASQRAGIVYATKMEPGVKYRQ